MDFAQYGAALQSAFISIRESVQAFLPNLFGALALLAGGWALAAVLRRLCVHLARRLDQLARRPQVEDALLRIGVRRTVSDVIGAFVFWTILLFFIAAATEALGLGVLTAWLSGVAYFLPRIVAAGLVLLTGLLAASLARDAILATSATANLSYGEALSQVVRIAIVSVTALIAVNALGIDVTILTVALGVVLGATLGGVALAFGLGARTAVSNIIGCHYLRQMLRIGQTVRLGGAGGPLGEVQGVIVEITATAVVVKTADGHVIVPAKEFNEARSTLVTMGG